MLSRLLRVAPLSRSFSAKTNIANINQKLVEAQYAVRGELVLKAADYQKMLATKGHKLPFDEVVFCNIGNPQELGQMPISFFRQVLALCVCPDLMNNAAVVNSFAPDAVARAKRYLASIPGGTGAYSTSQGVHIVREEVAKFIEARDGYPADPENIFLTDGASSGVKSGLSLLIRDHNDGILTPVPQYPLYSATIALQGGTLIPYLLDEGKVCSFAIYQW
jgi:alanine transaminase